MNRILATNDDGIESPGLRRVAQRLAGDYEVVIAAPAADMSGSGTGIGRFDPAKGVGMNQVEVDGVTAFSIEGPPGLAVMAAALGAFGGPPDLVISGVNAGINTGHSVIHSGTVGAALTARTFNSKGLAVSLAQSDPWHWDTAVAVATQAVAWLLDRTEPRVLNVNVPALPIDDLAGIHWADLDEFGYFRVAKSADDRKRLQLEVGSSTDRSDPGSDTALCRQGYVTVTPLSSVEPAPFPDSPASDIWSPA